MRKARHLLYRVYNGKGRLRGETPFFHVAEAQIRSAKKRGKKWKVRTFYQNNGPASRSQNAR